MVALVELTLEGVGAGVGQIKIVPHAIIAFSGTQKTTVHLSNGKTITVTQTSAEVERRLEAALGTPEEAAAQMRRFIDMIG